MKVEAVTLREIRMPLVHFFETSFGRVFDRRILLVTVHCEGVDGWGECVAEAPFFSEESIGTAWHILRDFLIPSVLGKDVSRGRDIPALLARIRGNRMAKAALENAVWDAEARARNLPLYNLLGGSLRKIACGVSIGIQNSHEQLLDKIETELAAGYQRIKVKVKPGWDLEVLAKIRHCWPKILLSCDANSAYTLSDIYHLKEFDAFKLLMIEQPLWNDDFYFHAQVQKQISTDICLDESIRSARDAQAALELGACRIINIKVGRIGGFTGAIAVRDVAQRACVPLWCGGMLESGVGRAHNIALSTLAGFSLPGDVSASKRYWKEDIIDPEVEVDREGFITVSELPGTGYRIREDRVEELTVAKETVSAQNLSVGG